VHALKQLLSRLSPTQRKFALGGAAVLALLAIVGGVMLRSEDARAVAGTLRSPLSIFASRSPGARLGGVLQTKPEYAAKPRQRSRPNGRAPREQPRERVLSVGRTRPPAPLGLFPDAGPLALVQGGPTTLAQGPGFDLPTQIGPGFDVPAFGFGDTPGFTGAPGNQPGTPPGTGGPGTNSPGTGSPGSAVPEPATWLMMILGLGIAGVAMRRGGASLRTYRV
jgi:hypothetical protein